MSDFPPGEYAIVELFGHTTLVGRIAEVERFGAKMLALEPLFEGEFLPAIFHGGAAIYRLTPCSAEVAFARGATESWELPAAIRAILPVEALPAPIEFEDESAEYEVPDPYPAEEPEDKLISNDQGEQFAPIDDDEILF
ncbi:MAG TPA: hypothetical protein VKS24_25135 [Bradyrhizobium sp.]|nr:hypothetical protein [Bradyrhizobium sp.]